MKLFLVFLSWIFCYSAYAQDYPFSEEEAQRGRFLSVNASIKLANSVTLSRAYETRDINTGPAFGVGIEYVALREDERNGGLGFEYQFKNKVLGIDGTFQNLPVYLFYDFSLLRIKYIALPNVHLQLGYNFLNITSGFPEENAKDEGGLYYALGVSSPIAKHLYARILYSSNQGKIAFGEGSHYYSNNKISLTILYR